eukprot:1769334-Alexandrium_andersonii.AAC.1
MSVFVSGLAMCACAFGACAHTSLCEHARVHGAFTRHAQSCPSEPRVGRVPALWCACAQVLALRCSRR